MYKILSGAFALALCSAVSAGYPAPQPEAPRNTAITPAEVAFPLQSGLKVVMEPWTRSRTLDGNWKISGVERSKTPFNDETKGFENPAFDDSAWDAIAVPLNWYRKYPKTYRKDEPYNRGFYRHKFTLSADELKERRTILRFEFVGYEATLWVNGREAGSHHGDFIPWSVDITDFVRPGENVLMLRVKQDFGISHGNLAKAVRTYGSQWSPDNIKGGIWGSVDLSFEPLIRIERFHISPRMADGTVELSATINNTTGKKLDVVFTVTDAMKSDPNRKIGETGQGNLPLAPGRNGVSAILKLDKPQPWSPETPQLYYANAIVIADAQVISGRSERFGWREFAVKDGKFQLNGERIYLFGENVPSVTFGGFGRPRSEESERLYRQLAGYKARGYNILRNAHMPITEEALTIADEIGIMFYDEWSWSFTAKIDEEEFQRRNEKELLTWLERDGNHPSVVMWSGANEVRHSNNPAVYRQLNRQVELLRKHDWQRRPAGSFSGSADYSSYGAAPLVTDFLDLHAYLGNGNDPWTHWPRLMDSVHRRLLQIYDRKDGQLGVPYVIWESVGFSWGKFLDPDFKVNDTAQYARYVKKTTSWGEPNGVGYIGTLGLAAALDPERGLDHGKRIYGKRLLELQRQDTRIDGIAPWFHGYALDAATLWTQPVLPGLRNYRHHQSPRSVFAGRELETELYIVNSTPRAVEGAEFTVALQTPDGRRTEAASFRIGRAAPFELYTQKVTIPIPPEIRGNSRILVELRDGEKLLGQNFYDVFAAAGKESATPIAYSGTIALLDAGNAGDLEDTAQLLRKFGLKTEVINGALPDSFRFAVIPAGIRNSGELKLDFDVLLGWVERGGTLLVLEQNANAGTLLGGVRLTTAGQTMVDLVHPAHPVFRNLEPANFDTWENPDDFGHAVSVTLSPFLENALAVRGAMLGNRGVDNAVLEATLGKGRLFWSQLNAVKLSGRDAVAATYLRNVFDYLLTQPMYDKVRELAREQRQSVTVDPEKLTPIDLRGFANRGFSDEIENDGKGGWTDQGANDLRNIPTGRRKAAGIWFDIIDPARNSAKSCLVLRGSERQEFPAEITGIAVNGRYARLHFLHTAAWSAGDAGAYRVHYTDGTAADIALRHGVNIGDWWSLSQLSEGQPGIVCSNPTKSEVGTYVMSWTNPHPEKTIRTLDFLSASSGLIREINFNPSKSPVAVLVAVTGEKK